MSLLNHPCSSQGAQQPTKTATRPFSCVGPCRGSRFAESRWAALCAAPVRGVLNNSQAVLKNSHRVMNKSYCAEELPPSPRAEELSRRDEQVSRQPQKLVHNPVDWHQLSVLNNSHANFIGRSITYPSYPQKGVLNNSHGCAEQLSESVLNNSHEKLKKLEIPLIFHDVTSFRPFPPIM